MCAGLPLLVCLGLPVLLENWRRQQSALLMLQSIPVTADSWSWYSRAAFSNLHRHTHNSGGHQINGLGGGSFEYFTDVSMSGYSSIAYRPSAWKATDDSQPRLLPVVSRLQVASPWMASGQRSSHRASTSNVSGTSSSGPWQAHQNMIHLTR